MDSSADQEVPQQDVLLEARQHLLVRMLWVFTVAGAIINGLILLAPGKSPVAHMPSWVYHLIWVGTLVVMWVSHRRGSLHWPARIFVIGASVGCIISLVSIGPWLGLGAIAVFLIIASEFLISSRWGTIVFIANIVVFGAHLLALQQGWIRPPAEVVDSMPLQSYVRIYVSSLMATAVGLLFTRAVLKVIRSSHERMLEEQRQARDERIARLETEQRMQANQHFEALGKLAGGVAHDMNNALTAILCSAELLRMENQSAMANELVDDILGASRNASQTTRQLLSLNRRRFCRPTPTNLAKLTKDTSRLASRLLPEHIRIELDVACDLPVLVDPADFQQAILNMMINARDAMPEGGSITLRTRLSDEPGKGPLPRMCVDIQDTGTGIDPEQGKRLFEPFFTTKPVGKGTGLGLAVVHAFVEEAGGKVTWTSTVGQGTTFTLHFPTTRPKEDACANFKPSAKPAEQREERVLLVEDQDLLRKRMADALRHGGFQVVDTRDARTALTFLDEERPFDLLCTDGLMSAPPNAGRLVHAYRDRHPKNPVLIISGHVEDVLLAQGLDAIENGHFLRKPFSGLELLAEVQRLLD